MNLLARDANFDIAAPTIAYSYDLRHVSAFSVSLGSKNKK